MINTLWNSISRPLSRSSVIEDSLLRNSLFQDLNSREISLIEKIIHIRSYQPGEEIFKQNEHGVGMYIIQSGSVSIMYESLENHGSVKKSHLITRLERDDFFGELALIEESGKRSASAIAFEETTLIGFFKPDLFEVVERSPNTGVKILTRLGQVIGYRLRETTKKISELKKELKDLNFEYMGLSDHE